MFSIDEQDNSLFTLASVCVAASSHREGRKVVVMINEHVPAQEMVRPHNIWGKNSIVLIKFLLPHIFSPNQLAKHLRHALVNDL